MGYSIDYKANDAEWWVSIADVSKIREWYENTFIDVEVFFGSHGSYNMIIHYKTNINAEDGSMTNVWDEYIVFIALDTKTVSKRESAKMGDGAAKMLSNELRLFDRLGYLSDPLWYADVKQDISDWWNM